jgi:SAM-dependent methyltransferase
MSVLPARTRFQGVLQILQFNRQKYLAGLAVTMAATLACPLLPPPDRRALLLGTVPALFWMASSLLVSHYVYDIFPLYDFRRIARLLARRPDRWINLHCGWDETSERLAEIFPASSRQVVDIFDAHSMTEISIRQARQANRSKIPAIPARFDALPFNADFFDAAFSIFAAHELRHHAQRVRLLREIARILAPGGELVVMEHSRDWPNFLAFGPGFLHFFSRRDWRRAFSQAGLIVRTELAMTPFVHVYILRRGL